MDSRKIVEVLRATLDANQQQQAHEQLQQVRNVTKKAITKFDKTNTWSFDNFALKVNIFVVRIALHNALHRIGQP